MSSVSREPRARPASPPILAFISSRLLLMIACDLCLTLFPLHPPLLRWQRQAFPGNNWLDGWIRWDSLWYETIVDSRNAQFFPRRLSSANFFPFYSWASWLVSLPFRPFLERETAFYAGALVLSHAAFLAGLIGVYRLATILAGRDAASRTVWLIAFFPFSFFFSTVYPESLYLCLAVWSLYFAHSRKWPLACALAALAALTRPVGFALYPALVVEYLWQHRSSGRSLPPNLQRRRELACGAILAAAPVVLATYFWVRYGSPVAFVHARQVGWQRTTDLYGAFVTDYQYFTKGPLFSCGGIKDCLKEWDLTRKLLGYWYLSLIPACVALTLYAARTLGPALCVWVLCSVLMALPNGLDGVGRYSAVLFPVFIALAIIIRNRAALIAVCALWVPFLLLFLFSFARWRPVL